MPSQLDTFSKFDESKIDWSEYEDVSDKDKNPNQLNPGIGGMLPNPSMVDHDHDHADMSGDMDEEYDIMNMDEKEVGTTKDVFPKQNGEGMITKKLLKAAPGAPSLRTPTRENQTEIHLTT